MNIIYQENALSYEAYYALRENIEWTQLDATQTKDALRKSAYDIIAMDNQKVVGMGRVIGDGIYYLIVDVIVHDAYQGKGIGRSISKHLLDYIEKQTPQGSKASVLLISASNKEPFYEKLGFTCIPDQMNGSGMKKSVIK